jgi:2'-5' RNA ligase
MRLFIALELPPEARSAAGEVARQLKSSGAEVKWVKPESMHLTLKFLGETPDGRAPEIAGALAGAVEGKPGLELAIKGCGAFPGDNKPQVVWLGLEGQVEGLKDLAAAIEGEMDLIGFPPERRSFKAHLTLGRLRRGPKRGRRGGRGGKPADSPVLLARAIAGLKEYQGPAFRADKVVLIKSTLTPAGPIYEPLAEFKLG